MIVGELLKKKRNFHHQMGQKGGEGRNRNFKEKAILERCKFSGMHKLLLRLFIGTSVTDLTASAPNFAPFVGVDEFVSC